ncbi:beta-glucanase [Kitasatospora sp. NPDC101801]|uniref:glycoside hydrolase family 16 protein n=1 Tax=Kitasatospora sp. NPDC101801 TaxID=3364103 RepID=UPI003819D96F
MPAGTYRMFGYYQDQAGAWRNLPEQRLIVTSTPIENIVTPVVPHPTPTAAPSPSPTPTSPIAGAKLIWSDEFDGPISARHWNKTVSSAYRYGTHNPDDDKLDRIDPAGVYAANGVATFTARQSTFKLPGAGSVAWNTGLLTTENSGDKFMVKTGDYAETRVQLPEALGAWPALWTWKDGANEVDSFEYHPDNPGLLELTNHVNRAQKYWTNAAAVKPGQWVTIGTRYGADSVGWYINGVNVFEDKKGVGKNWTAYLILNLSLCSGDFHPGPNPATTVTFASDYVRVFR